jgi:hypothetical protein
LVRTISNSSVAARHARDSRQFKAIHIQFEFEFQIQINPIQGGAVVDPGPQRTRSSDRDIFPYRDKEENRCVSFTSNWASFTSSPRPVPSRPALNDWHPV